MSVKSRRPCRDWMNWVQEIWVKKKAAVSARKQGDEEGEVGARGLSGRSGKRNVDQKTKKEKDATRD